jgi:uncharacterized protein
MNLMKQRTIGSMNPISSFSLATSRKAPSCGYLVQQKQVSALASAWAVLQSMLEHARHRFLPDSLGYESVPYAGLLGHRQITDAYLSTLATHHRLQLATFDEGLAALHRKTVILIPRTH